MADKCIFCGGAPTTVEHILSRKWIAELMPNASTFTSRLLRVDDDGATLERMFGSRAGKGDAGSHSVRCVCRSCNNGWMQELDVQLRPALTGLATGERGSLSPDGCRLFSIWATKIALLTDELWEQVIPSATKLSFGKDRQPPPGWTVWVGLRGETDDRSHLRAVTLGETNRGIEAAAFMFRVLHLVVQVLAPINPVLLVRAPRRPAYLDCIWPRLHPLRWPPAELSWIPTDEAVEELENAVLAQRPRRGS